MQNRITLKYPHEIQLSVVIKKKSRTYIDDKYVWNTLIMLKKMYLKYIVIRWYIHCTQHILRYSNTLQYSSARPPLWKPSSPDIETLCQWLSRDEFVEGPMTPSLAPADRVYRNNRVPSERRSMTVSPSPSITVARPSETPRGRIKTKVIIHG